jgi:very-short-patch-repair endonuclease
MPPGAVAHWQPKAAATGSGFAVAPLELAVPDLLACQPQHHVVAVLDSLLHRRLIQRNRLDALLLAGPVRMRSLVDSLDARSEEGIESIVRFRLAAAGIRCRIQVVVRSGTRVDLLIDDWLVLEIDGKEIHAKEEAFTPDRVRAAWVMRHGRFVLRFAYATVIYDWDFVLDTVRDVIAQHAPIR